MITSKLMKDANKADLIVMFSLKDQLPQVILQFRKACKNESITFKKSNIPSYQVSFYYVDSKTNVKFEDVEMKDIPTELQHVMTIIYMNHENESKIVLPETPGVRTLLLREDLESKYSLEYEIQSTESKRTAITFLCDMTAAFLNKACCKNADFFDQKTQQVIKTRKNEGNVLRDTWVNIIYQIPGIGKEKSLKIAQKFPTYQSIVKDYKKQQQLMYVTVGKTKIGKMLATRIYKIFVGTKYNQSVIEPA